VIMSAVTIPDMARIVEEHGLVIIPVDLDPETMTPRIDLYERAFSPRTRLVMVAHLLGGSFDVTPYADIANARGIPLVEDCAQAFRGPGSWGSERALASFFSFGSIKTSTSLGAAVAMVRDRDVLERMRTIHATRPLQGSDAFARKAMKYLGMQGLHSRLLYGAVAQVVSRSDGGLDGFIRRSVKGFPAGNGDLLLKHLRQRPGAAQAALLRRRLERFDSRRLDARAERGEFLQHSLRDAGFVLGRQQPKRTHWLFAISVDDPCRLIHRLRKAGFDATQGATTIGPLTPPAERNDFDPRVIREAMSRAVFLPAYPELPRREASRLIQSIVSAIV